MDDQYAKYVDSSRLPSSKKGRLQKFVESEVPGWREFSKAVGKRLNDMTRRNGGHSQVHKQTRRWLKVVHEKGVGKGVGKGIKHYYYGKDGIMMECYHDWQYTSKGVPYAICDTIKVKFVGDL